VSITHKITHSISSDSGGTPLSGIQSSVGVTEIVQDVNYGASLANQLLSVAFIAANVQDVFLLSDKGLTIGTNSSSSPVNTIVLKPGTPLAWENSSGYFPNPFTANVTAFYITTTVAARLQVKILTT
jgi:hypothetical protein